MLPYYDNGVTRLYRADARALPLPDESVHCVVTSPPYWGLRDYKLEPGMWGGEPACAHAWDHESLDTQVGRGNWSQAVNDRGEAQPGGLEAKREPVPARAATATCAECGAWLGSLGLEPTVDLYIEHLVGVFREVHRVLRPDGVCWVNIGDSYYSEAVWRGKQSDPRVPRELDGLNRRPQSGFKPGDRLGIPERLVLALHADGWTYRAAPIWAKDAPTPESVQGVRWERHRLKVRSGEIPRHGMERGVGHTNESDLGGRRRQKNDDHPDRRKVGVNDRTQPQQRGREPCRSGANPDRPQQDHDGSDYQPSATWRDCPGCRECEPNGGLVLRRGSWRPTSSYEQVFMLTLGMGYHADGAELRTPIKRETIERAGRARITHPGERDSTQNPQTLHPAQGAGRNGANLRSVWDDIPAEPYPGEHYAVFPSGLPARCIQASTSEKGVCPECGAQWARVVERRPATMNIRVREAKNGTRSDKSWFHRDATDEEAAEYSVESMGSSSTIGWRPTCGCDAGGPVPALVLDPFVGVGTTCLAAQRLGRRSVGVDLSRDYLAQGVKRLGALTLPLDAAGSLGLGEE